MFPAEPFHGVDFWCSVAVVSLWLGMLVPYKGAIRDAPISDITHSLNNAISKTLTNSPVYP